MSKNDKFLVKANNVNVVNTSNPLSELVNPGDKLTARITKTNRKVVIIEKDNGNHKRSTTVYPNGTTVRTETIKR